MEFRTIESDQEARHVFPVMKELREKLDEENFLRRLRAARDESNYSLIGAFEGNNCAGLMGFRVLTDFVHGRHLYIDDLVVTDAFRSMGLGAEFLERAKAIAVKEGCEGLRLCTGIDNERGKKFYERNGWQARALAFKMKLT